LKKIYCAILLPFLIFTILLTACTPVELHTSDTTPIREEEQMPPAEQLKESEELCGIWIATAMNINFPSEPGLSAKELAAEIDDIITCAKELSANAVFFQVRPSSDAFYPSEIFPTSKYLTGEEGAELPDGLDVLRYLITRAHENGIAVHAWVNPLRASIGVTDTSKLSDSHPAKLNPEYVIPYADGRLYFDPGLPEVRQLIADGVSELAANYKLDGIVFDDYFYPYPTTDENGKSADFDDSETYQKYGAGYSSLGDFRRDNVNKMIKECYSAIKSVNTECKFGVAPFGIRKNDDGTNGGSKTNGLSSYYDIYCDPLAWVKGGYIDYLAPQIYWEQDNSRAPFNELCDWWDNALRDTEVEYYVSYAAYRYENDWEDPSGEITAQIGHAREKGRYRGGILYGYDQIYRNVSGLKDEIKVLFGEKEIYVS